MNLHVCECLPLLEIYKTLSHLLSTMLGVEKEQGIKSDRALGFSLLFKLLYENSYYYQHPTHTALTYEGISV